MFRKVFHILSKPIPGCKALEGIKNYHSATVLFIDATSLVDMPQSSSMYLNPPRYCNNYYYIILIRSKAKNCTTSTY